MAQRITKIQAPQKPSAGLRVAAYARVSTGKDAMIHSLSAQVSYYNSLIQSEPGWLFAGVYADEALTGTKRSRQELERLMGDCRSGKVDMVITKSISRFARNTVDLLSCVRELRSIGVDVYFEEQRMHTIGKEGELMLSIFGSYAQEESRSASENVKWRVRAQFREGIPTYARMIGYRMEGGRLEVVPSEAEAVREIYALYLSGMGLIAVAKRLNSEGRSTLGGKPWGPNAVRRVLTNPDYKGCLLLQRTFRNNHMEKRKTPNRGEMPMYSVDGDHEAIVSPEDFDAARDERLARSERFSAAAHPNRYPFSGLITCRECGKRLRRKTANGVASWMCPTANYTGRSACGTPQIREDAFEEAVRRALGWESFDPARLKSEVASITAGPGRLLSIEKRDGSSAEAEWEPRSRSLSWTPEMKRKAAEAAKAGRKRKCQK